MISELSWQLFMESLSSDKRELQILNNWLFVNYIINDTKDENDSENDIEPEDELHG